MASTAPVVPETAAPLHPPVPTCIKTLSQSTGLTSIPSAYAFTGSTLEEPAVVVDSDSIPVLDFSLLTSGHPDQRSKAIHELREACQNWGFFMLINHGVPESLIKAMIDACDGFFNLAEEDKREYEGKHVLDPIRYGTSFNPSVEKVRFWRDYLKVFVHPQFHSPKKPEGFSDTSLEYSRRSREVALKLVRGISESLGLEDGYIEKALNLESGLQILAGNVYPPCPQPEMAMGLPPHSDHGLLTLLAHNQVGGLQWRHKGKWVQVNPIPNSFLVNTGDHIEILSNGKYKSVIHRAIVNNKATRISVVTVVGPSLDAIVSPARELITDNESNPPLYIPMKYNKYVEMQQSNRLDGKSGLDRVRSRIG